MTKYILFTFSVLIFTLGLLSNPAKAQNTNVPAALQDLADRGAQLRPLGKAHGLDGWLAVFRGQVQYFYITEDGKAFISGILQNVDGENITVKQLSELDGSVFDVLGPLVSQDTQSPDPLNTQPQEPQSKAEILFSDIENSNWIALGKETAPVIYTFIDPNCPHCHDLIKKMRSDYIESGFIQLRLIPVGFLTNSLEQAAFLLASPNPQEKWFAYLDGDGNALPVDPDINTQAVQKNMLLMQNWNLTVTPFSAYRDVFGQVKVISGIPEDINSLLSELP